MWARARGRTLRPMTAMQHTAPSARTFERVLCVTTGAFGDGDAIRQAALLAGTAVELAGNARSAVLERAREHDLVVVPPGALAMEIVAHSPVPVMVARRAPAGDRFPESILIAVDDTDEARAAARIGARLAADHGAVVALVSTPEHDEPHRRALDGHVAAVVAATGRRPLVLDEQAPPAHAIAAAAGSTGASLIVMGSRPGRHADSLSIQVARDAACSVLVLRAERAP